MEKCYTIIGTKSYDDSKVTAQRYIQLGDAGNPIIQTKTGYQANRVILFEDKEQANNFLINFIYDRKRMDIKWEVVEYKPSILSDTLVGMMGYKDYYGTNLTQPGELYIDYRGIRRIAYYPEQYTKLNGTEVSYYTRKYKESK